MAVRLTLYFRKEGRGKDGPPDPVVAAEICLEMVSPRVLVRGI
jgi:hypothetical protein